jgi:opacity protein-like surface antigen
MRQFTARTLLAGALLLASAGTAAADLTAFLGGSFSGSATDAIQGDSSVGLTRGVAVGFGLIIVGFEFEYAQVGGDDEFGSGECSVSNALGCSPSLTTTMGNVLLQTPRGILPVQIYGTVGAGMYRERFDPVDLSETSFGTNVGGGVKIEVAGPFRIRVDYRVFKLSGDAVYSTPQRLYVGANLAF